MKISVDRISEYEGLTIDHQYGEGKPRLDDDETGLSGRTSLNLRARREGEKVFLSGKVRADVRMDCNRCLTSFVVPVEQNFDLVYLPPAGGGEEKELGDDDLLVAYYQEQVIDIDDVVREQIELALPMSRLCNEECRGLCPECGVNLNEVNCNCASEQVDSRWDALKGMKSDN